jgi:hypothetical protein
MPSERRGEARRKGQEDIKVYDPGLKKVGLERGRMQRIREVEKVWKRMDCLENDLCDTEETSNSGEGEGRGDKGRGKEGGYSGRG